MSIKDFSDSWELVSFSSGYKAKTFWLSGLPEKKISEETEQTCKKEYVRISVNLMIKKYILKELLHRSRILKKKKKMAKLFKIVISDPF